MLSSSFSQGLIPTHHCLWALSLTGLRIKHLSSTCSPSELLRHHSTSSQGCVLCAVSLRKPDAGRMSRLSALSPRPEGDLLSLLMCLQDSFSSPALPTFTRPQLQVHRKQCFLGSSNNFPQAKLGSFLYFQTTGFCCTFGCSGSSATQTVQYPCPLVGPR